MKRCSLVLAFLAGLWLVHDQASGQDFLRDGDVTIVATSTADAPCADCPDGKGTKICYEVKLDEDADNDKAKDFHILTTDGDSNNYACFTIEKRTENGRAWEAVEGWSGEKSSDKPPHGPGKREHYVTWKGDRNSLDKGGTYRFCFVYCKPEGGKLTDKADWLLTYTGGATPGMPDDSGNRSGIPNIGKGGNDPGWSGRFKHNDGAKIGFAVAVECPDIRTLKAACNRRGQLKAIVTLTSKDRDGELMTLAVGNDGRRYEVEVTGKKAKLMTCCFEGPQEVWLLEPEGCVDPALVNCSG